MNQDKVSVVLGPLSGGESLAIKQAAKEWPNTTFLTIGAANLITMKDPAPNVYRPSFAGGQPVYPLAEWAINNKIEKIVTIGEDYAFPLGSNRRIRICLLQAGGTHCQGILDAHRNSRLQLHHLTAQELQPLRDVYRVRRGGCRDLHQAVE